MTVLLRSFFLSFFMESRCVVSNSLRLQVLKYSCFFCDADWSPEAPLSMALRRLVQRTLVNHTSSRLYPALGQSFSTGTSPGEPIRATLFPGDGIGPEIAESVKKVLSVKPNIVLSVKIFSMLLLIWFWIEDWFNVNWHSVLSIRCFSLLEEKVNDSQGFWIQC